MPLISNVSRLFTYPTLLLVSLPQSSYIPLLFLDGNPFLQQLPQLYRVSQYDDSVSVAYIIKPLKSSFLITHWHDSPSTYPPIWITLLPSSCLTSTSLVLRHRLTIAGTMHHSAVPLVKAGIWQCMVKIWAGFIRSK